MKLIRQRGLVNISLFFLINFFLLNIIVADVLYAQDDLIANLSPQTAISQYDFSQAFNARVIDSYIADSLLTEFEYRCLKLDIIFNTKTNPGEIERQLKDRVSKQDLLIYFSDKIADAPARLEVRLKIRKIFHAILEQYGYKPFTLGDYQDKIMEKLWQEHNQYLARSSAAILAEKIGRVLEILTPEEILLFRSQPSSPSEHVLKKKVTLLIDPGLSEEGIVFDEKVWAFVSEIIRARKSKLLEEFDFNIQKYDQEFKQRLTGRFIKQYLADYFSEIAGNSLESQKARKKIYGFFMDWLVELDGRINKNSKAEKIFIYNEGILWQSRYKTALDKKVGDVLGIDSANLFPAIDGKPERITIIENQAAVLCLSIQQSI